MEGTISTTSQATALPRVTIQFCTQCKWMLRAAYFAQELLSTFSTSLGEVALQPSTGGTFVVRLYHAASPSPDAAAAAEEGNGNGNGSVGVREYLLWDRKVEGGFPETKELKRRVRDIIDPKRDLGHVDGKKATASHPQEPIALSSALDKLPSTETPIPEAVKKLQSPETGERKSVPMDIDSSSQSGSSGGEKPDIINARGKIVITGGDMDGEGFGFCRPGDEDCG